MIKISRKLKKAYLSPKKDQTCFSSCFPMSSLAFLIFKNLTFLLKMLPLFFKLNWWYPKSLSQWPSRGCLFLPPKSSQNFTFSPMRV